jgi:hypothetical protein
MVHQTGGVTEPPLAIDHMAKQGEKVRAVPIIAENFLASTARTCNMGDRPGEFKTQRTSHGPSV